MVGTLPTNLSSDVSYRGNAFVYEATTAQLGFTDLSGGWCTGNEVGELLSAQSVSVSVSGSGSGSGSGSVSSTPVQKFCCSYHQISAEAGALAMKLVSCCQHNLC